MGPSATLLFVYGTLRRTSNHLQALWLRRIGEFVGTARVQGRLYRIGRYPGLVPCRACQEWVDGDLFRLPDAEAVYKVLDAYEGCAPGDPEPHEFRREMTRVVLESGRSVHAATYVYRRNVRNRTRITSASGKMATWHGAAFSSPKYGAERQS